MQYFVEEGVTLGVDVVIEPFAVIRGNSVIGDNAIIGSGSVIIDSTIGANSVIHSSRIVDSTVSNSCTIGPYAHIRGGSVIEGGCRIGDYVEVKNSTLGSGSKASHLSYIGDSSIGRQCNIGCGVIFVNYDGKTKHHSAVGDNVFVGCNSNIVSPVTIGSGVYIACGTTVAQDLPDHAFAIGRSNLTVKKGYATKYI